MKSFIMRLSNIVLRYLFVISMGIVEVRHTRQNQETDTRYGVRNRVLIEQVGGGHQN